MPQVAAARRAAELGFDHLDVAREPEEGLALPVADMFVPSPRPGCSTGAPAAADGNWERAVRAFRRAPGARIEPWGGSILDSVEKIEAFLAEAPGTSLLLDTGHVACWGEDPSELIPHATHIQLRQARKGIPQALEGDIDFGRFIADLSRHGYEGKLSIEYFDLPEWGFPLDEPLAHAISLARQLRPLLG
jgi:sugar phosphate isomerase/epimerase